MADLNLTCVMDPKGTRQKVTSQDLEWLLRSISETRISTCWPENPVRQIKFHLRQDVCPQQVDGTSKRVNDIWNPLNCMGFLQCN